MVAKASRDNFSHTSCLEFGTEEVHIPACPDTLPRVEQERLPRERLNRSRRRVVRWRKNRGKMKEQDENGVEETARRVQVETDFI